MIKLLYRITLFIFTLCLFLFASFANAQTEKQESITEDKVEPVKTPKDEKVIVPFAVLEVPPRPIECEDAVNREAFNCFSEFVNNHIKENFKYPRKARKKHLQGRVTVMLVIDKEGKVTNIKTRAPKGCEILEQEARRIIGLLPQVLPGMQRGKPVRVSFAIPINFVLTD